METGFFIARWKDLETYHLTSPNSTMSDRQQQNTYRLGRRPAQGPRPLLMNQDRVGKSVTGTGKIERVMMITDGQKVQLRKRLRLGTWNVRSLLQIGKMHLLGRELERLTVDLCGLCEVGWGGQGHFLTLEGHTVIYSGCDVRGMSRVAIWVHKKIAGSVLGYEPISDRLISVRLSSRPRNVTLIQAYGSTTAAK
jgi:hypothetical protein